MAVFVDLGSDDDEVEGSQDLPIRLPIGGRGAGIIHNGTRTGAFPDKAVREGGHESVDRENPNRNATTKALGCYPVIMAVASSIDLNTLDSLARTCRQVRAALLQYRSVLLSSTLRCSNDAVPVDPEETLRYRARAGNWYYMEDIGRSTFNGKSGNCARDMVSECRRCGVVVCRNCAIKPPAPAVLRQRYRRLCIPCTKAPIGSLVKPRLRPDSTLDSDAVQRSICRCEAEGVWLCHPCGRGIRGADSEYQALWRWRSQYGEVLGGLGTGIGEGDRGVPCGREEECCSAKEKEQETDCDAEDARELEEIAHGSTPNGTIVPPWGGSPSTLLHAYTPPVGTPDVAGPGEANRRTPSPALGPGYDRHEIEGIGGVVKTKLVRMVRVGACVPEYEDEKDRLGILSREVQGQVRSWCGWCWRVIPGKKDYEFEERRKAKREAAKAASGSN